MISKKIEIKKLGNFRKDLLWYRVIIRTEITHAFEVDAWTQWSEEI